MSLSLDKSSDAQVWVVYETWDVSRGLSETTRFSRALFRSRHIGRVRRTHNCRIAMSYQAVDVSITAVIL